MLILCSFVSAIVLPYRFGHRIFLCWFLGCALAALCFVLLSLFVVPTLGQNKIIRMHSDY